ncbi:MAG TPA: VWA domain-containing protein [Pyrinomonadaceae bacterium]|nr:VWA domain-containing protein [Pyrinomonadaceae bacterium]
MSEYFVETSGNDSAGGKTAQTAWKTLKHALDTAEPDSVINLGFGEFPEALRIKKNVTLRGQGKLSVIKCPVDLPYNPNETSYSLPPPKYNAPETLTQTPLILVAGPIKVRFENLKVSALIEGFNQHGTGIVTSDSGARLEIESCRILEFRHVFIFVLNGELLISNSKIATELNLGSDLGITAAYDTKAVFANSDIGGKMDHSIDLFHDSFAEVTHCTLRGATVFYGNCIRMFNKSRAVVSHNNIIGQPLSSEAGENQSAIFMWDDSSADVNNNLITGFSKAFKFNNSSTARVWNNAITNNYNYAVDYSFSATEEQQPDFGGGFQGSPGENLFEGNGEKTGFDVQLAGKGGTCFARFNRWPTGNGKPRTTVSPNQVINDPLPAPFFDYLPVMGIEPEPLDAALLVDQSGSMLEENKWTSAKAAVDVFSSAFTHTHCSEDVLRLGLLTFAETQTGDTQVWKKVEALNPQDTKVASLIKTEPKSAYRTPIGSGLSASQSLLDAAGPVPGDGSERRKYIFLLSDGKSNAGPEPASVYETFKGKINVYSIGFGDDSIDPEMISEISNATMGDYVLTKTTDNLDLKRFFLNSLSLPLGVQVVVNTRASGLTTFPVNAGEDKMLVLIGWEDPSLKLHFDLKAPGGTLLTPDSHPADVTFRAEAGETFSSYTIPKPASGDWVLTNIRQQNGGPAPEVCKFVALDPVLVAQFWLDRGPSHMGRTIRLNARLLEDDAPLETAEVRVKITTPKTGVGMLLVKYLSALPNLPARISAQLPQGRILQRSDLLHHYRRSRTDKRLPTATEKATLKLLRAPEGSGKSTGIFQVDFTPEKEGTYTFEFVAEGKSKTGASFRRTYTVSKYVSFAADPWKTLVTVMPDLTVDPRGQGVKAYLLTFIPIAANGDRMGPLASSKLSVRSNGRIVDARIQDNMDGSYTARVSLQPGETVSRLGIYVGGIKVPVAQQPHGPGGCLSLLRRLWK